MQVKERATPSEEHELLRSKVKNGQDSADTVVTIDKLNSDPLDGQDNPAFEDRPQEKELFSTLNSVLTVKNNTTADDAKARTPIEAASENVELTTLSPGSASRKNGQNNGMNGDGVPYPGEVFISVNTHRKFIRGEKLYLTRDTRRNSKLPWRRMYLCGVFWLFIAFAVLIAAITTSIVLSKEALSTVTSESLIANKTKVYTTEISSTSASYKATDKPGGRTKVTMPTSMKISSVTISPESSHSDDKASDLKKVTSPSVSTQFLNDEKTETISSIEGMTEINRLTRPTNYGRAVGDWNTTAKTYTQPDGKYVHVNHSSATTVSQNNEQNYTGVFQTTTITSQQETTKELHTLLDSTQEKVSDSTLMSSTLVTSPTITHGDSTTEYKPSLVNTSSEVSKILLSSTEYSPIILNDITNTTEISSQKESESFFEILNTTEKPSFLEIYNTSEIIVNYTGNVPSSSSMPTESLSTIQQSSTISPEIVSSTQTELSAVIPHVTSTVTGLSNTDNESFSEINTSTTSSSENPAATSTAQELHSSPPDEDSLKSNTTTTLTVGSSPSESFVGNITSTGAVTETSSQSIHLLSIGETAEPLSTLDYTSTSGFTGMSKSSEDSSNSNTFVVMFNSTGADVETSSPINLFATNIVPESTSDLLVSTTTVMPENLSTSKSLPEVVDATHNVSGTSSGINHLLTSPGTKETFNSSNEWFSTIFNTTSIVSEGSSTSSLFQKILNATDDYAEEPSSKNVLFTSTVTEEQSNQPDQRISTVSALSILHEGSSNPKSFAEDLNSTDSIEESRSPDERPSTLLSTVPESSPNSISESFTATLNSSETIPEASSPPSSFTISSLPVTLSSLLHEEFSTHLNTASITNKYDSSSPLMTSTDHSLTDPESETYVTVNSFAITEIETSSSQLNEPISTYTATNAAQDNSLSNGSLAGIINSTDSVEEASNSLSSLISHIIPVTSPIPSNPSTLIVHTSEVSSPDIPSVVRLITEDLSSTSNEASSSISSRVPEFPSNFLHESSVSDINLIPTQITVSTSARADESEEPSSSSTQPSSRLVAESFSSADSSIPNKANTLTDLLSTTHNSSNDALKVSSNSSLESITGHLITSDVLPENLSPVTLYASRYATGTSGLPADLLQTVTNPPILNTDTSSNLLKDSIVAHSSLSESETSSSPSTLFGAIRNPSNAVVNPIATVIETSSTLQTESSATINPLDTLSSSSPVEITILTNIVQEENSNTKTEGTGNPITISPSSYDNLSSTIQDISSETIRLLLAPITVNTISLAPNIPPTSGNKSVIEVNSPSSISPEVPSSTLAKLFLDNLPFVTEVTTNSPTHSVHESFDSPKLFTDKKQSPSTESFLISSEASNHPNNFIRPTVNSINVDVGLQETSLHLNSPLPAIIEASTIHPKPSTPSAHDWTAKVTTTPEVTYESVNLSPVVATNSRGLVPMTSVYQTDSRSFLSTLSIEPDVPSLTTGNLWSLILGSEPRNETSENTLLPIIMKSDNETDFQTNDSFVDKPNALRNLLLSSTVTEVKTTPQLNDIDLPSPHASSTLSSQLASSILPTDPKVIAASTANTRDLRGTDFSVNELRASGNSVNQLATTQSNSNDNKYESTSEITNVFISTLKTTSQNAVLTESPTVAELQHKLSESTANPFKLTEILSQSGKTGINEENTSQQSMTESLYVATPEIVDLIRMPRTTPFPEVTLQDNLHSHFSTTEAPRTIQTQNHAENTSQPAADKVQLASTEHLVDTYLDEQKNAQPSHSALDISTPPFPNDYSSGANNVSSSQTQNPLIEGSLNITTPVLQIKTESNATTTVFRNIMNDEENESVSAVPTVVPVDTEEIHFAAYDEQANEVRPKDYN